MSSATAYKVQVKLGQAEFSAEGPEDTVKEHLASFLQIASTLPPSPVHQEHVSDLESNGNGNGHINGNGKHIAMPATALLPGDWNEWLGTYGNRLFAEDAHGLISVR